MNRKITPLLILLLVAISLAGVPEASAITEYKAYFEANYSFAVGTRIDNCLLCHTNPFGGARNPYGVAYRENGHNFAIIEPFDSDGDGFTNIDEIKNRTFPGDAIDFPFGVSLTADALSKTTVAGTNATYTLTITNTGLVTDNYTLAVDNPDGATTANLSTNLVQNLVGGTNTIVLLNVTSTTAGNFMVNVTATSQGAPTKMASVNTTTAVSAPITFTITATAGAGGTITPSGAVVVNQGADQTFAITPNTGFVVADVLVDGVSVGAVTSYTFTNVQADHTISASFTPITFTITATAGAGGTINPSGAVVVNQGADQTFAITPNTGFVVADVLVDGVSVGAVTSYTFTNVQADHTISASFVAIPPVTFAINGRGWIISPIPVLKGNDRATFRFEATNVNGVSSGELTFRDHVGDIRVSGNVTTLSVNKTAMTATFSGIATINRTGAYTYTVTVVDNGPGEGTDTFAIALSTGYMANGTLGGGNIRI